MDHSLSQMVKFSTMTLQIYEIWTLKGDRYGMTQKGHDFWAKFTNCSKSWKLHDPHVF